MQKLIALTLAGLLGWMPTAGQSQSAQLSDAQIAAVVVAANDVDIDAGKLAQKQASDSAVKDFGKQMETDHEGVNKQAKDLARSLKLKPEENDTSKGLKADGDANVRRLKRMKGKEFDKAYIDNEVSYHQKVIDAMDKTLIPSATNASLKALLVKVRPAFVAHLDHAKKIQAGMK